MFAFNIEIPLSFGQDVSKMLAAANFGGGSIVHADTFVRNIVMYLYLKILDMVFISKLRLSLNKYEGFARAACNL